MNDEGRRKAHRTQVELKETEEAFAKLRAGYLKRLLETEEGEQEERERLYLAVKVLDAVRKAMTEVVQSVSDTIKIEEAVDAFHKRG